MPTLVSAPHHLHLFRYTSKGSTVYAFLTAKPSKSIVELLHPKCDSSTSVKPLNNLWHLQDLSSKLQRQPTRLDNWHYGVLFFSQLYETQTLVKGITYSFSSGDVVLNV